MGEAESFEVMVSVVIASRATFAGWDRVGTPLHHAEGNGGTGKVVAAAEGPRAWLGAGQGVNVISQTDRPGGGRRRHEQDRERRTQQRKFCLEVRLPAFSERGRFAAL